jgi:hypothetical protein
MFAVINEGKVVSFITDESQKAFLLENHPDYTFAEFEWELNSDDHKKRPLMFNEVQVNSNGSVTVLRN